MEGVIRLTGGATYIFGQVGIDIGPEGGSERGYGGARPRMCSGLTTRRHPSWRGVFVVNGTDTYASHPIDASAAFRGTLSLDRLRRGVTGVRCDDRSWVQDTFQAYRLGQVSSGCCGLHMVSSTPQTRLNEHTIKRIPRTKPHTQHLGHISAPRIHNGVLHPTSIRLHILQHSIPVLLVSLHLLDNISCLRIGRPFDVSSSAIHTLDQTHRLGCMCDGLFDRPGRTETRLVTPQHGR